MRKRGGRVAPGARWVSLYGAALMVLIASGAALAEGLRFTFEVPEGWVAESVAGTHLLVSPEGQTSVHVQTMDLATAAEVEEALERLAAASSDRQLKKVNATTWRLTTGPQKGSLGLHGGFYVRLFPGKGTVVLLGLTTSRGSRFSFDPVMTSLARSLREGPGAPGGEPVRAKKQPKQSYGQAGPWRLSWTSDWERAPVPAGLLMLVRKEAGLFVMLQDARDLDAKTLVRLGETPYPLGATPLAPTGETQVAGNEVIHRWRNDAISMSARGRCDARGCVLLYVGGPVDYEPLHPAALAWFRAHLSHASAMEGVSNESARKAPDPKHPLVRRVAGKRLHYSMTTASSSDGIFVGGTSAKEIHLCKDGSVYSAEHGELVGTGYQRTRAGVRQGVWALAPILGQDGLSITWSDGGEEVYLEYNPLAAVDAVLEQASKEERRKIEKMLAGTRAPNQILLMPMGTSVPWTFQMEPSALCAR